MADNFVFRRGTGSKEKDKKLLEISEEFITLQNKRENALIVSFVAPVADITNVHNYFDDLHELEPVFLEIADAGAVEYTFRGISPIKDVEDGVQEMSVTLQLKREFL
ncbi:MAG: hypothetical protein HVN34_06795 [Methanobacteriaceae archaeon]|jgi:hypothetical protein|nr:hypothetical protein [Methanobacteriaceae archaeon]